MITKIFQYYLKYILWVMIIAAFSFVFEAIYSSSARNFLLTVFIAASLGFAIYATRP